MQLKYENCEICGCLTLHDGEQCLEHQIFEDLSEEQQKAVLAEATKIATFACVALKYCQWN